MSTACQDHNPRSLFYFAIKKSFTVFSLGTAAILTLCSVKISLPEVAS